MRKLLGVIAGVVALGVTVWIVEMISHMIWTPPAGVDVSNPAQLAKLMDMVPLEAKIAVVVAWFLGAIAGAWVGAKVAQWSPAGWIVVAIGICFGVMTLFMIPHPLWMQVAAVVAPLAGGWIATKLAGRA